MTALDRILAEHGLEHLGSILSENRIDVDVLHDLTDDDLKDIGVSLGDRKRFLKFIAAREETKAESAALSDPSNRRDAQSELRPITVLFADLVGSTKLAADHDVEDSHAVLASFHKFCSDVIRDHGGTADRFIGDALLGCFGYPHAKENDAARAVRAAERIAREAPSIPLSIDHTPQARVGVATGVAMTGDLIADGRNAFGPATGAVLNLAARLQALATPGKVLIDQSTRDLTPPHVSCEFIGAQEVKGFAEPQPLWRVEGIAERAPSIKSNSIFQAEPLVGRAPELATLERCWGESERKGSFVLVAGEAGIGKTRIVNEFIHRAALPEDRVIRMECAADEQLRPLRPVIAFLEDRFRGDRAADAPSQGSSQGSSQGPPQGSSQAEALRRWIVDDMKLSPQAANVVERLIAPEEPAPADDEAPRDRKTKLFETLTLLLERMGLDRPNLFLIEDVHWIDPTTQEFLDHLVERIAPMKAMIVCTYRPDHHPNFIGQPRVNLISLSRLEAEQSAELMRNVLGEADLPPDLASEIVARADGVPFFVEELTKSALEAGSDDLSSGPARAPSHLPTTLHGSLLARLDRVPGANQIAPVGAAIGRSFPEDLLLEVTGMPAVEAGAILLDLIATGLLTRNGAGPEAIYTFKHALVRDAAYETMPKSRRIEVHGRIAVSLENLETTSAATLASHYARALEYQKACDFWFNAGVAAQAAASSVEAVSYLKSALSENERTTNAPDRRKREIKIRSALYVPLQIENWGSRDILENMERLRELRAEEGLGDDLLDVLHALSGYHIIQGQVSDARRYSDELAEKYSENDSVAGVLSLRCRGFCHFLSGEFEEAINYLRLAIKMSSCVDQVRIKKFYQPDTALICHCLIAWCYAFLNRIEDMINEISVVLPMIGQRPRSWTRAYAHTLVASAYQVARMPKKCREQSDFASSYGLEVNSDYWISWNNALRGWLDAVDFLDSRGVDLIKSAIIMYKNTGSMQCLPYFHFLLYDANRMIGNEEARKSVESQIRNGIDPREVKVINLDTMISLLNKKI